MDQKKIFYAACAALLLVVLFFARGLLFGGSTQAPPVQYMVSDEESFKLNTQAFHEIPFDEAAYEFDIKLPKDWIRENVELKMPHVAGAQQVPEDIARFKSPRIGTAQMVVTVQDVTAAHEISARNWLKQFAVIGGYTIDGDIEEIDNKRAAMAYGTFFEGKSTYTRVLAQISGDTVFILRFEMPDNFRGPFGFLQKRALDSFRLINPSNESVEQPGVFVLAESMRLTYPESWTVNYYNYNDPTRVALQLHNQNKNTGALEGIIRVAAIKRGQRNSLDGEITLMKKYFETNVGLSFTKLVSSDTPKTAPRWAFARDEVYQTQPKKEGAAPQELHLAILGDKDWYVFAFLLTPTERDDFNSWARNTQTFNMLVRDLK